MAGGALLFVDHRPVRRQAWDEGQEYSFVIVDSASGTFVGGSGLNQVNLANRLANLGYWVRTSWANRGAATAATFLTARFGFEKIGLQRIEIVAAVGNKASPRVGEKIGA